MKKGMILILLPLLLLPLFLAGCDSALENKSQNSIRVNIDAGENRATIYGNPLNISQIALLVNDQELKGGASVSPHDRLTCAVDGDFGEFNLETFLEIESAQQTQTIAIEAQGISTNEIADLLPANIKCSARLVNGAGVPQLSAIGRMHYIQIDSIEENHDNPGIPAGEATQFNGFNDEDLR